VVVLWTKLYEMAYEEGDLQHVQELLGPPVDIAGAAAEKDIEKINALAFELYKEASVLVGVVGHLVESTEEGKVGLARNQAVCVGLLIRMAKFMLAVTQLSATRNRGEVVQALNRCIIEPAINFQFLVTINQDKYYDQFVLYSFGPERELYDMVMANIKERGGKAQPIEERMLLSIRNKCKASGVDLDEVPAKHREWAMNMRGRLKAIGDEKRYIAYRMMSHSVHGTWMDLLLHHLERDDQTGLFRPDSQFSDVDARILTPLAKSALVAVQAYIRRFYRIKEVAELLNSRIEDLLERVLLVDEVHEKLFSTRGK
jgi:hypothetical protein